MHIVEKTPFIPNIGGNEVKLFNSPLQRRFIMGMCIMFLPLIFISFGAFGSLHNVINAFEDTAEETIYEQSPIMRLQTLLLKVWMPANDYLVHGNLGERENFNNLSREVDESFKTAFSASYGMKGEQDNLRISYKEWQVARKLGQDLVNISNPIANKEAAKKMEIFDYHINKSVDQLEKIYILTKEEIDAGLKGAHSIRDDILLNITITFAFGFFIAIISALVLARSILKPLQELDEGVTSFGNGQFSQRVKINTNDELGDLAKSFNNMAENIVTIQDKLKYLSNHDYLTGLYNRLEFYKRLDEEMEQSKHNNNSFSLLLIDIDYFKNVNDIYGHTAGDEALCSISKTLTEEIRNRDFVARYGGEEFVVILSGISNSDAIEAAERIREKIASNKIDIVNGQRIQLTISIGMAFYSADGNSARELIAAADDALYAAKNTGRNTIKRFEELSKR